VKISGVGAGETEGISPASFKSRRDNPPLFSQTACKISIMRALVTMNELQTQLECNTIAFSDEAEGQGSGYTQLQSKSFTW